MTSANPNHASQLLDALDECATLFNALLDRESESLTTRDASALADIAAEKRQLAERIDQLSNELGQAVPIRDGNLSAGLPDTLKPRWLALREELGKIQEKNQQNGHRVLLQGRQIDAAMAILKGSHQEHAGPIYGADGQKKGPDSGHRHVKV